MDQNQLLVFQKVNHFREAQQLSRKDFLKKNVAQWAKRHRSFLAAIDQALKDERFFFPESYILPHETKPFIKAFTRWSMKTKSEEQEASSSQNLWILKPVGLSRGRGIKVIRSLDQVGYTEPVLLQRYITNPLLLRGYKFDLRIYVVVLSFQPVLEAYIYKEGFARCTTQRFSLSEESLTSSVVHLTNSSVQHKEVADNKPFNSQTTSFLAGEDASSSSLRGGGGLPRDHPVRRGDPREAMGTKLSLKETWKQLAEEHGLEREVVWEKVKRTVLLTLFSVQEKVPCQPSAFELFGFDVMLTSSGDVKLIEVNTSPSLGILHAMDRRIKGQLIKDTLRLVQIPAFDREALVKALYKRLRKGGIKGIKNAFLDQALREERKAGVEETFDAEMKSIFGSSSLNEDPLRHPLVPEVPSTMNNFDCIAPFCGMYQDMTNLLKTPS